MPEANPSQPEAISLTPEQAQILLRADLSNLAKKVKQGKTLSGSERNLLQAALSGDPSTGENFAKNQAELAKALGVNRKTIQRARKRPGNPGARADGRYEIQPWREFLRGTNEMEVGSEDDLDLDPTKERVRHILLRNQKLEAELSILRKEWVSAADVEKWGGELGAAIRKVVTQIHLSAPSVVGLSVADAESRLKEIEDQILEQFHLLNDRIREGRDESAA